jgi:RNA polymerase sigma-70 factor (ECF subfamily)
LAEQQRVAQGFITVCAGGDLDALIALLDPDAVGNVDLGPDAAKNAPLRGRTVIAPNLLRFFGPRARVTLVSQPINGNPGVLAFRDQQLVGMLQLKTRDGLIYDLHAIRDPNKLAFVGSQLSNSSS